MTSENILSSDGKYTVVAGDTLLGIALKVFGSEWGPIPVLAKAIYDLNKDVIGENPNLIKPGMVFEMPPADLVGDLRGYDPETGLETYTVKSGDSLWAIARSNYPVFSNDTRHIVEEIYRINRDAIGDNPNLIYPGTELQLPPGVAFDLSRG